MDYNRLAELLFPHINTTPEEMEARYPKRELPEGAKGNPYGPEPTGFMHLGNLYGALVMSVWRTSPRVYFICVLRIPTASVR